MQDKLEKELELKDKEIQSLKTTLKQIITIINGADRSDAITKLLDIKAVIKQELSIKD